MNMMITIRLSRFYAFTDRFQFELQSVRIWWHAIIVLEANFRRCNI